MAGRGKSGLLAGGSKRELLASDLMGGLVQRLQAVAPTTEEAPPGGVGGWACQKGVVLDRGPFSFSRHEFLEEPYSDNHPQQVAIKAAQTGNTTQAILTSIYDAIYRNFVGVLYLFPSAKGVGDFSVTRVSPLIDRNPDSIGKYVQSTNAVGVKRVKFCNILFRGVRSKESIVSDPVDRVVVDEKDLMPEDIDDVARERMAHSDFRCWYELSNPSIPGFGVDRTFQISDGRRWLLKCPRCGKWTDVIGEWENGAKPRERALPDLIGIRKDGSEFLRCMQCRDAELDKAKGQWVALRPNVTEWRGRQYSQLFSQYVPLKDIVYQYQNAINLAAVYNFKLGLPYAEADCRITREEILDLCGSHGLAASDAGPCCMGVDQGKGLHVVIGRRDGVIVYVGELRDFEELDRLMDVFHVVRCVIDGMPETRKAREFAMRFPGRVYLNWYSPKQKGAYAWNEEKMQVSENRTESLDASHAAFTERRISLPRQCKPVETFADHAAATAKKLEEDDKTGSKVYTWVKLGPDHYRHAFNYWCIAADFSADSYFSGRNWG